MTTKTDHEREAFDLGAEHARSAASWAADGNESNQSIRAKLRGLRDGDPAVWDYLPPWPNLSGEMAGDPTPLSIAREITGLDDPDPETIDLLSDAYEEGVMETFESACEAELLRWVNEED
jgi:hypothetical protein